ncbi:hypothetical protein P3T35_002285 [Kitasatospora sp. GP30]|uniref:barstar family protein n=1 Tax=Kitasatospora sp. GP30 TaxID=3035084 RepID=UPI000C712746|nr:barstar family protein [Kitasatospora sp. GP30]MDH6140277.1 hypothetical protein [Kitasatospora sp. GP30]
MPGPLTSHPWARLLGGLPRVRGSHCRTRPGLFREWAAGLRFPDYFGHNWDAFEECLGDLLRPPGAVGPVAVLLLVTEADQLLADEPPGQLAVLLGILDTVSASAELRVLFDTPAPALLAHRIATADGSSPR